MKALKVMKLWRQSSYARSKWLHHRKWEKDGGTRRSGVRKEDKWCSSRIMEDWLWWSRSVPFLHALSFFLSVLFACSSPVPLTGPVGHAGFELQEKLLIYDLLHEFSEKKKKKWQLPCQRDILHERRDKYTFINRTQKCSWKHTHTLAQKINHGQKNERHLCSSTQKWQSVHLQPSNPKQLSVNLWRPQCLPITWQR